MKFTAYWKNIFEVLFPVLTLGLHKSSPIFYVNVRKGEMHHVQF